MSTKDYTLTREEVAQKLNVSVRTVDRYIRRNYFDTQKIDHHVLISQPSFEKYYDEHTSLDDPSPEEPISPLPTPLELSSHEHDYHEDLNPANIFKELYEDLKLKHDEQQKRLEGAHYRVGQLEAQVKTMIPLIEFEKEQKKLLSAQKQYQVGMEEAQGKLSRLKRVFLSERLNKNIYIALAYLLLALHVVFWGLMR